MSFVFYVQPNWSNISTDDTVFVFDAINNLRESLPNQVTKYPVANSAARVDHIQPQNVIISFTGYVNHHALPNNLFNIYDFNYLESSGSGRIATAQSKLRSLRNNGTTFSFIKSNIVYKNCSIKSLEFDTTRQSGDSLVVNITLEQIRISTVDSTESTLITDDTSSEESTGTTTKTTTSSDESIWSTIKSYLSSLVS